MIDKTPMETARRHLQKALTQHRRGQSLPVVTLGAHDALEPGNHDPHASTRPHATVHLTAQAVLIGPWGGDGTAPACGQCLAMRWQRLRSRSERDALEACKNTPTPVDAWPLLTPFALDAAKALHDALLTDGSSRGPTPSNTELRPHRRTSTPALDAMSLGTASYADRDLPQVTRLNLATLHTQTVPLLADPLCPHCGPREADESTGFQLQARTKPHPRAQRLHSASSYPLPTHALANPVTGVLGAGTWMNITSPTTAPVAGSAFVRGYAGLIDVTWSGQANSFAASRDLALLEGLERYAGTHRRTREPLLTAAYAELGDRALNPTACGSYSQETYRDDPLVSPFDPQRPIPWVLGYSLRDDRPLLVPARLAHYSAGIAADNFVFESSNGCAIGGSREEALLGGLLELIERDAFLLAWYGGTPLTEIDLTSVSETAIRRMIDRAALQGYEVRAFDNRIDLAVPVVTALAVRRDGGPGTFAFGAGASLDPAHAVEAALSEVLTYIPHLPRQVAERATELKAMAADYRKVRHLQDHAQLYGLPEMAPHISPYLEPAGRRRQPLKEIYRGWEAHSRPRSSDLRDDLLLCRDELVKAGHDVIAVDQTTPEQRRAGLHTFCTIVPGLLPIDFGWSRQRALLMPRLRSAARRAGLRETDLTEREIRRVPHPFP